MKKIIMLLISIPNLCFGIEEFLEEIIKEKDKVNELITEYEENDLHMYPTYYYFLLGQEAAFKMAIEKYYNF